MKQSNFRFFGIILILLSVLTLISCNKADEAVSEKETENPVVSKTGSLEEKAVQSTEAKAVLRNEGIISFLTGDVFIIKGDQENYAEIGDSVMQDDTLQTGPDGYCELQIGETAVISISEDTDFTLAAVSLKTEGSTVQGKMNAGTVAFKVNKLLGQDRFNVVTPSSVCGVRGTHFLVRVKENKTTEIAVSEGRVAVLPPEAVELQNIMDTAPEELAAVLDEVLRIETTIEAGSQLVVEEDDLAEVTAEIEKVVAAVENIEEKSAEEVTQVIQDIEVLAVAVETAVEKTAEPEVLTSFNMEILKPLEDIEIVPVQKQVKQLPLKIHVLPSNADIYLNGSFRGKGHVSALYEDQSEVEILIRSAGYEERLENVTMNKELEISFELEKMKREIRLKVEPVETVVFLDGKELGSGDQTGAYALDSTLLFTGRLDGYNPASLEVRVDETSASEYLLKLSHGPRGLKITAEPSDAVVRIDGKGSGRGSLSGEFAFGEEVGVSVSRDGYKSYNRTLTLDESVPAEMLVSLEASDVSLTIEPSSSGAAVTLNGQKAGSGTVTREFPFNSEVSVRVSGRGYETEQFSVSLSEPGSVKRRVSLKALPEWGRYKVSSEPLVGQLLLENQNLTAIDSSGQLKGVSLNGSDKWSYDSGNEKNEASFPVLADDSVLFAGISRFVSVDVKSGKKRYSRDLGSKDSLPFGNRPLIAGDTIVYPEQGGLRFLNRYDYSEKGFLALGGLLMTTPSVRDDKVYVADLKGVINTVSLKDFSLVNTLQTTLKQPAGIQMTIDGRVGYMGDSRGTFIAVDLVDNRVLWQQAADSRITSAPSVYKNSVYISAGKKLYSFSRADASFQGMIAEDAVTPPLVSGGRIYYGNSEMKLVAWNIGKQKTDWSYPLKSRASTKAVMKGSLIAVGLENGEIVVVNSEAFR